jgi:hypothetical protein
MNKKGIVEAQLNWIFILFAGAIILSFFVSLAFWWTGNQNTKLAGEVMYRIETILTGASVSENTATKIDVPRANLRFSCDAEECNDYGCASQFEIEGTGISQGTEVDIIYSQNLLQADYLYAWTQSWSMPYKVTNFLYLSAPNVKYYFVYRKGDDASRNLAQSVAAKMGENEYVNLEVISSDEVQDKEYNNEYLIKYIIFYELGKSDVITVHKSVVDRMGNWDVMFIYSDGSTGDIGNVKFSTIKNSMRVPDNNQQYPYFGRASLIGAIYAEDFDNYKCNMKKALLRLRTVNAVYQKRTAALYKSFLGDAKCEYYYDSDVQGYFADIQKAIANPDSPDTGSLASAIEELKRANTDAIIRSCPRLY